MSSWLALRILLSSEKSSLSRLGTWIGCPELMSAYKTDALEFDLAYTHSDLETLITNGRSKGRGGDTAIDYAKFITWCTSTVFGRVSLNHILTLHACNDMRQPK